MKPRIDLDALINKQKAKQEQRFPGDSSRIREGVSLSMGTKKKRPSGFVDSAKVNEHVAVTVQDKN